jgi:hypothetical protein
VKLDLPFPKEWTDSWDGRTLMTIAPGVTLSLSALSPLPDDLGAWREQELGRGVLPGLVRVRSAADGWTSDGWPIATFVSDVGEPPRERRLHAFVRFYVHGAVAVLRSSDIAAFDATVERVRDVLSQARPDYGGEQLLSLDDVWAGFGPGSSSDRALH